MRLTIQGALLFLFIPLVLVLYLRQPLGPRVSLVVGLVIMFGHRFVAAPWMARHATERCLWCGRAVAQRPSAASNADVAQGFSPAGRFSVFSGGRELAVVACSARHGDDTRRFLTFISLYRLPIAIGIFVPLVVLITGSLAQAAGHPFLAHDWNAWQFRTIVALTVVTTSLAYRAVSHPVEPLRSPFPLHNLFLLGIRNTLWVFRLVGAWWLAAGAIQAVGW
jgi:hypothetical protein